MASISIAYRTYNTIQVQLIGLDTSYSKTTRTCTWTLNGQTRVTTLSNGISSGGAVTFSGLKSSSTYSVSVLITAPASEAMGFAGLRVSLSSNVSTSAFPVAKWDWNSSTQNKNAYIAITNKDSLSNFSYLVWNDMVDRVSSMCNVIYGRWDGTYGTVDKTKMTSLDKNLTADRFNALRYNIDRGLDTGINTVSRGHAVYGNYFISLMNVLNSWINLY